MTGMDLLVLSRASTWAETADDDPALDERHWAYMDGYADRMTARGPTLGPDRESWTGSLHVVTLTGFDAAREFVEREPYQQAGAYAEHSVWRFTNLLGRTMWDFAGPVGEPRFLVLALRVAEGPGLRPVPVADLPDRLREGLVLYGELHDREGRAAGLVLAIQATSRTVLDELLANQRTGLDLDLELTVHDWEFGGRR